MSFLFVTNYEKHFFLSYFKQCLFEKIINNTYNTMIQNEINCHERWSFFFLGGGGVFIITFVICCTERNMVSSSELKFVFDHNTTLD
jgi:hypothetical protein